MLIGRGHCRQYKLPGVLLVIILVAVWVLTGVLALAVCLAADRADKDASEAAKQYVAPAGRTSTVGFAPNSRRRRPQR